MGRHLFLEDHDDIDVGGCAQANFGGGAEEAEGSKRAAEGEAGIRAEVVENASNVARHTPTSELVTNFFTHLCPILLLATKDAVPLTYLTIEPSRPHASENAVLLHFVQNLAGSKVFDQRIMRSTCVAIMNSKYEPADLGSRRSIPTFA